MGKAFSEKQFKKHFSNILLSSFSQLFLSVIQVTTLSTLRLRDNSFNYIVACENNELHEFYPELIQTLLVTIGIDAASPSSSFNFISMFRQCQDLLSII